jgi:TolB protein
MKRLSPFLLIWTICLLAACSADGKAAAGAAQASHNASQPAVDLPGRLLYVRDKQIWMHEGKNEHSLQLTGEVRDPAWSADGKRVAFVRQEESFSDLYVLNMETGEAIQATSNGSRLQKRTQQYVHAITWAAKPAWSPDGQTIVFLSQKDPATWEGQQPSLYEFPLTLYRYKTNLIGARRPTNEDILGVEQQNGDVLSPAWSPDGRYLAYVQAPRDENPRRIMLYDFQSEQAKPYPGIADGAYDPAWSPDGHRLAFAVNQNGATDIWAIEGTENGTPQRLTKLGRARSPAWSPDGSMIAFINVADDGTNVFTISPKQQNGRLEGGDAVQVTGDGDIEATAGLSWGK